MNKADVLAKLDKFKGQPVEIGVQDEGNIMLISMGIGCSLRVIIL